MSSVDINKLTARDKAVLLKFRFNNDLPTRTQIDINESAWLSEEAVQQEVALIEREFKPYVEKYDFVLEDTYRSGRRDPSDRKHWRVSMYDAVSAFSNGLVSEDTKELHDSLFGTVYYKLKNVYKSNKDARQLRAISDMIYFRYLKPMALTFDVHGKKERPELAKELGLVNSSMEMIFECLRKSKGEIHKGFLIYCLTLLLGETNVEDDGPIWLLSNIFANIDGSYNADSIFVSAKRFIDGSVNVADYLDKETATDELPIILQDFKKERFQGSNFKDVTSTENSGRVMFGSGAFDESDLPEVERLMSGRLQAYVGGTPVTYLVEPKELGFLITNGYQLAKVMKKNGETATIAKKDDQKYLLFHVLGVGTLKGIGFPEESNEVRKLLEIDINENLDYELREPKDYRTFKLEI